MNTNSLAIDRTHQNEQLLQKVAKFILVILPPIVYLAYIQKYALNLPKMDDYDAILLFLNNYVKAPDFSEKFRLLLSLHNEHRILFARLIFLADYYIRGQFNFLDVIFVNYSILVLIYFLCISFARRVLPGRGFWVPFVAGVCLFTINAYENCNFAMAGAQNFGVIMLFMAAIYFYSKERWWWLPLAIVAQVLCSFTSGNGNLASFLITVFVWFNGYKPARFAGIVAFLLFAPLYYYHYAPPGNGFGTKDPGQFLPYFTHVAGAHFGQKWSNVAAIIMMLVFVSLVPFGKRFMQYRHWFPLLTVGAFLFISCGVIGIFRGALPLESAYSSRYFIYSNLITFVTSILLVSRLQSSEFFRQYKDAVAVLLVVSFVRILVEGDSGYKVVYEHMKGAYYDYPDGPRAQMITNESCTLKIYCIDPEREKAAKLP